MSKINWTPNTALNRSFSVPMLSITNLLLSFLVQHSHHHSHLFCIIHCHCPQSESQKNGRVVAISCYFICCQFIGFAFPVAVWLEATVCSSISKWSSPLSHCCCADLAWCLPRKCPTNWQLDDASAMGARWCLWVWAMLEINHLTDILFSSTVMQVQWQCCFNLDVCSFVCNDNRACYCVHWFVEWWSAKWTAKSTIHFGPLFQVKMTCTKSLMENRLPWIIIFWKLKSKFSSHANCATPHPRLQIQLKTKLFKQVKKGTKHPLQWKTCVAMTTETRKKMTCHSCKKQASHKKWRCQAFHMSFWSQDHWKWQGQQKESSQPHQWFTIRTWGWHRESKEWMRKNLAKTTGGWLQNMAHGMMQKFNDASPNLTCAATPQMVTP